MADKSIQACHTQQKKDKKHTPPLILDNSYKVIRRLAGVAGCFNKGIFIVEYMPTHSICLLKTVAKGEGEVEANLLSRLNYHPHITIYVDSYLTKPENKMTILGNLVTAMGLWPKEESEPRTQISDARREWDEVDRLYIEYCDQGTLEDYIERFIDLDIPVPKHFVENVFMSLAKAIRHCHYGPIEAQDDPQAEGWDPIIHRDIILTNVFLNSGKNHRSQVKLGDFGCALTESQIAKMYEEPLNVPGQDLDFADPANPGSFCKCSDIYQIGLIIWCLCHSRLYPESKEDGFTSADCVNGSRTWQYSDELRILLDKCLSPNVNERPTAIELVELLTDITV